MPKIIKLDHITKIEGHAKLNIKIDKGEVKKARLEIVEGARFFEAIIQGRNWDEISPLTSRICGICSPIHAITSLKATENAFGIRVTNQTELLRELLILGGIIQSHVMHLFFLALPDYLGYSGAIEMAKKYKDEISLALKLKNLGNGIVKLFGGREIHPITAVVGGFSEVPEEKEVELMLDKLRKSKKDAKAVVNLFQNLKYPDFSRETKYFALEHKGHYPVLHGNISCVGKQCVPTELYDIHFQEYMQQGSTAKFVVVAGKSYMVGSLARLNNNHKNLSKDAKKLLKIEIPNYSPFMNNVAQAIELVHSIDRSIEILEKLELIDEKPVKVVPRAGRGVAVTEAPRGLLFHDYIFNKSGCLQKANIITPTAQNLRNIEEDLKQFLPSRLKMGKDKLIIDIEKLIRSYDPCISCSAHFLEINWE
ncbi:MAG: Ni/Fe hydrogenase subunit alpha [Candidatus Woesearchaeota archaeon]